ncbi:MAG TPA: M14 family metallopeptidase [Longimicrobiales bacterium]|nr:M14 family metallopeptidase [Longimicrobiales bacterium]
MRITRRPAFTRGLLPVTLLVLLGACAGGEAPSSQPLPRGAGPEDLTVSLSRPITDSPGQTVEFTDPAVWISTELQGGRGADVRREGDSVYVVGLRPENAPINNSPWYAFKVWSATPRTIDVQLRYRDGDHRYWPKVRRSDDPWTPLDSAAVRVAEDEMQATIRLRVGPDTLWVAGQEMLTSSFFRRWTDSLAALPGASQRQFATSPRRRPLRILEFGDPASPRHVVLISRQHPPEVTGTFALLGFVGELMGDTELARRFRQQFRVHVVPLVNPDGVDLGHWRHNTGGVDLNRDWVAFHQPETRAVRDEVRRLIPQPGEDLWFAADFHSTFRDVFYTLEREFETEPADFADRWLAHIEASLPHYDVNDAPSDLGTPMSRNWFYREFGAPALIYEVGDNTPRDLIREVAETAARGTMEILLEEAERR